MSTYFKENNNMNIYLIKELSMSIEVPVIKGIKK